MNNYVKVRCSLLKAFVVISLLIVVYYAFLSSSVGEKYNGCNDFKNIRFISNIKEANEYNIWLIFTKVSRSMLKYKFRVLLESMMKVSSIHLNFHLVVDPVSQKIAEQEITSVSLMTNKSLTYTVYDVDECANKIKDIVEIMTPHFSSKPGTYYSDALFYISLGLYRIAPENQKKAVLLDCDLYFKEDVVLLFKEFDSFKPTTLFGLGPELSPAYLHILHPYRQKHNTTFGDYFHSTNIANTTVHPKGFPGYNSGVLLLNLEAIRKSKEFTKILTNETVNRITKKYIFRGHLGDQDLYTLMGYEYPHLIRTLNCGFNRQLCTWWRDNGYKDIFQFYFQCNHPIVIIHGNCNSMTTLPNNNPVLGNSIING